MSNGIIDVIGFGALNMDYLYRVERILDDGEAVVDEVKSAPGGSAANTIYGLARLGIKTGFVGVVGSDSDGNLLVQDLQKIGADTSRIKVKNGAKTGSVLCLTDRLGKRSMYVVPGANNLLEATDLDIDYLNRAQILHVSSFVHDRQLQLILGLINELSPKLKLSFAPGMLFAGRGTKALSPILARTHILIVNANEIRELTRENISSGAETCLKLGCRIVVVTLGKGVTMGKTTAVAYIRDADRQYVIEPSPMIASEIETTGAGDAFAAGFLFGFLKGKDLQECGRLGDIVAQFKLTGLGARSGLPTSDLLAHRYAELYP